MSNALKTMVESSANTLSELVEEARSRLEDLPPIAGPRRRRARKQFSSVAVIVLLAFAVAIVIQRSHRHSTQQTADHAT